MFATREGNTVRIAKDLTQGLAGVSKGYKVTLHVLPQYTFEVQAESGDDAIKACVALCKRERQHLSTDAATFQRIQ